MVEVHGLYSLNLCLRIHEIYNFVRLSPYLSLFVVQCHYHIIIIMNIYVYGMKAIS